MKNLDQQLLLEYFLAADRGHHLTSSEDTCDDFYNACQLPEISIKNTLRDLVGIQYDANVDENILGNESDMQKNEPSDTQNTVSDELTTGSAEVTTAENLDHNVTDEKNERIVR